METKQYSAVIKWSIIIGIVIVINLFFNYAISLVYSTPEYNNFCPERQVVNPNMTQQACVAEGGQWNGITSDEFDVAPSPDRPNVVSMPKGYCDLDFTCRQDYDDAYKVHSRNVFVALVILGIALVAVSFVVAFNWTLSVALAMGGILSIIIASIRYWSDADNLVRVVILFLALAALIYFAVKKFKN